MREVFDLLLRNAASERRERRERQAVGGGEGEGIGVCGRERERESGGETRTMMLLSSCSLTSASKPTRLSIFKRFMYERRSSFTSRNAVALASFLPPSA